MANDGLIDRRHASIGNSHAHFAVIGSTNLYVKTKAALLPDGFLATADMQTNGRGRLGKTFYSSAGNGLYMSVLFKDPRVASDPFLTIKACLAVCDALEKDYGIRNISVKWVNDLYYNGRKFCGILAESVIDGDKRGAVVGIGINLTVPREEFDKEYASHAASVSEFYAESMDKDELCQSIARELERYTRDTSSDFARACVADYRARSFLIGKEVYVLKDGEQKEAAVLGVDDDAHLLVRYPDERVEALCSGEVSIKIL